MADGSFDDFGAQAQKLVLNRASLGRVALEIRQSADNASHHRGEQRLLAGKMRIDRRLARRSHRGNLVDARGAEALLEKEPLGRIEDSIFDFAGELLGRPAVW